MAENMIDSLISDDFCVLSGNYVAFIQELIQWRDIDDGKELLENMCIAKGQNNGLWLWHWNSTSWCAIYWCCSFNMWYFIIKLGILCSSATKEDEPNLSDLARHTSKKTSDWGKDESNVSSMVWWYIMSPWVGKTYTKSWPHILLCLVFIIAQYFTNQNSKKKWWSDSPKSVESFLTSHQVEAFCEIFFFAASPSGSFLEPQLS